MPEFQLQRLDGMTLDRRSKALVLVRDKSGQRDRLRRHDLRHHANANAPRPRCSRKRKRRRYALQSIGDAVVTTDAEGLHRVPEPRRRKSHRLGSPREVYGKALDDVFNILNEADTRVSPGISGRRARLREGRVIAVADHASAGESLVVRDRDSGFCGADPRSHGQDHRRGHGVP